MENILVEMDRVIEEIKEKELVIANVEGILKARVEEMKQKAAEQTEPAKNEIDYLKAKLRSLFDGVEKVKETKTQRKLTLLSGEVVIKKATQKIDYDKAKLLEMAKKEENERLLKRQEAITKLDEITIKLNDLEIYVSEHGLDDALIKDQESMYKNRLCLIDKVAELTELGYYETFIKSKTTYDFDWAALKTNLAIDAESIINTETGEVMEIDGLSVLEVPEELVIK